MPHFGIICPPITGHVNPLAAVGRTLIRRGHQVTLLHVRDMEAKARREGLGFLALGADQYPPGALADSVISLSKLSGISALRFSVACACRISELILRDGPAAVSGHKIDALLVDQNEPSGGTVAEHLGVPFLSVCTSLPLDREPLIPPPFVDWRYSTSLFARLRNQLGYAIADRLIAPIQAVLNRYRAQWKLPLVRQPNDTFSKLGTIAQMPRELDFPRVEQSRTFHYLGPWFDAQSSSGIDFPYERLDGRPMVYGSLGTLQSRDSHYFRVMAEACSTLDVQLVLSLGNGAGAGVSDLPGDPIVVNYAPQTELLARAAITITHAGMNTTVQSLRFGVPMVAIPLAHDQPAIAARIARAEAGVVLNPKQLTGPKLGAAVESLVSEKSPARDAAKRFQNLILKTGGTERAAGVAESIVGKRSS